MTQVCGMSPFWHKEKKILTHVFTSFPVMMHGMILKKKFLIIWLFLINSDFVFYLYLKYIKDTLFSYTNKVVHIFLLFLELWVICHLSDFILSFVDKVFGRAPTEIGLYSSVHHTLHCLSSNCESFCVAGKFTLCSLWKWTSWLSNFFHRIRKNKKGEKKTPR